MLLTCYLLLLLSVGKRLKLCLIHGHVNFCWFCVAEVMFVTTFALTCHIREVLDLRLQRSNLLLLFHHVEASTTVSVGVVFDLAVTSVVTSVYELGGVQILFTFLQR